MQEVASELAKVFPGLGFILMVFDFGDSSQMNYVANCKREDAIKALKEFIEKTERSWDKNREDGTFGVGGKS